jgi:aminopeptidase N
LFSLDASNYSRPFDENMRDSFAMDNTRHSDHYKKAFVKLSRTGTFLLSAIIVCSLVAVALLVYNFAACPQDDLQLTESRHHFRQDLINPTLSLTTSTKITENDTRHSKDLRLPRSIRPVSYDVVLLPFLTSDNFTFNGEVAIRINVMETCKNVTLHSTSLIINWSFSHIQKLNEDNKPTENVSITNQYFVDEKQFLVLETGKDLEVNTSYIVRLQFVGTIKDNLQGFYKSSYNVGTETKWIASTQFQATDARR